MPTSGGFQERLPMTKTIVSTVAFELGFSEGISMDEMFHWMVIKEKTAIKASGCSCQIITQLHEGYIFGALIAYKGDRNFLTTLEDEKALSIKRISLAENQNNTQASIFCIEPTSKSGMFFSYHGGASATSLGAILKKIHDGLRLSKIKELKKEPGGAKSKEAYKGEFSLTVKYTQLDMDKLLNMYSDVDSMEVTLGPAIEPESLFRPFLGLAKQFKTIVNLEGGQLSDGKLNAVRKFYNSIAEKKAIKSFKVAGRGLMGEKLTQKLGENLDHFGTMYLDDYISLLPKDEDVWDDFIQCEATAYLLNVIRKNVAVIPKPRPVSTWKQMLNAKDSPNSLEN